MAVSRKIIKNNWIDLRANHVYNQKAEISTFIFRLSHIESKFLLALMSKDDCQLIKPVAQFYKKH